MNASEKLLDSVIEGFEAQGQPQYTCPPEVKGLVQQAIQAHTLTSAPNVSTPALQNARRETAR